MLTLYFFSFFKSSKGPWWTHLLHTPFKGIIMKGGLSGWQIFFSSQWFEMKWCKQCLFRHGTAASCVCSHLSNWRPLHSFHAFHFRLVNQYANDMTPALHWAVSPVLSEHQQILADLLPPKSRLTVIWKPGFKSTEFPKQWGLPTLR